MTKALALFGLLFLPACTPTESDAPPPHSDEAVITWAEALRLFVTCEVATAAQTHSGDVTLTLTDGRIVHTREPHLDAIFNPDLLGPDCPEPLFITE